MTHIILYSVSLILICDLYRPRRFLETGFRPLCPSFVWFVTLSRTKPAFWISSRKPILSEPGWILLDGFDTRLIRKSFSCGSSCEIYESHMWLILMSHMWHILKSHMSMSETHISHMTHIMCDVTHARDVWRDWHRVTELTLVFVTHNWNRCGDQLCQGRWYPDSARYWAGVYDYILTHTYIYSYSHTHIYSLSHTHIHIYIYIYIYIHPDSARYWAGVYDYILAHIYIGKFRTRSFLESGFWPLYPSFVWFVPLSRTKRVFLISTRTRPRS